MHAVTNGRNTRLTCIIRLRPKAARLALKSQASSAHSFAALGAGLAACVREWVRQGEEPWLLPTLLPGAAANHGNGAAASTAAAGIPGSASLAVASVSRMPNPLKGLPTLRGQPF